MDHHSLTTGEVGGLDTVSSGRVCILNSFSMSVDYVMSLTGPKFYLVNSTVLGPYRVELTLFRWFSVVTTLFYLQSY